MNNNPHSHEPITVQETMDARAWRPLLLVLILGVIVLALTFASCVTAQDAQSVADAQHDLEAAQAAAQADLAAGVPVEQVQAAMKAALEEYTERMKGVGVDVGARTGSFWEMLKSDPLGSGLGLILSQLPLLLGLNARRNATRKKEIQKVKVA